MYTCGQVKSEVEEDMDVRGGGAAAEDARVVKQGYESEDDEAPRPLRHRDDDMLDAPPGAVRVGEADMAGVRACATWVCARAAPGPE